MGPGQGLPVSVLCSWDHFCEEGPVHCRMLSSITGLYPPDASSTCPSRLNSYKCLWTSPTIPGGRGGRIALAEKHGARVWLMLGGTPKSGQIWSMVQWQEKKCWKPVHQRLFWGQEIMSNLGVALVEITGSLRLIPDKIRDWC